LEPTRGVWVDPQLQTILMHSWLSKRLLMLKMGQLSVIPSHHSSTLGAVIGVLATQNFEGTSPSLMNLCI